MSDNVSFIVEAIDKATAVLQKVEGGLNSFGEKIETAGDKAKTSNFSFTELNQAWEMGLRVLGYAQQAYDAIITTFLEYADSVRTLSDITGESIEETSRVIQLTDDYKISTQELEVAQRKLATQGKSLSVETLAQMSDEYLSLNSGVERQTYLTENLGRAGANWTLLLKQGSTALREQGAAVNEALILNQRMLDQARQLEVQQDNLNDTWQAFVLTIAPPLTEEITRQLKAFNDLTSGSNTLGESVKDISEIYKYSYAVISGGSILFSMIFGI